MKQKLTILLACISMAQFVFAQNTWEIPQQQSQQSQTEKTLFGGRQKNPTDPKYLAHIPVDSTGNVTFEMDYAVKHLSAEQIYDSMFTFLTHFTQTPNQLPGSKIAVVNKDRHIIIANIRENLVFQRSTLSLDQTEFRYSLVIECKDGAVHVTMNRLYYLYEQNRPGGLKAPAREVITDEWALNKKKTKLARYYGKFRVKTLDRRDNIFIQIQNALK